MPIYYLDTSAVMKRYIPEIGSDVVEELFEELTNSEVLTTSYLTVLARIHRFIQVDGVRTAEGCEGVTGAIIRA